MVMALLYLFPTLAGIIAGKYLGRFTNFCVMIVAFQIDLIILTGAGNGRFDPRLLIPIIFIWPPLSLGQFIPPLFFILVAIVVYRIRYEPAQTP